MSKQMELFFEVSKTFNSWPNLVCRQTQGSVFVQINFTISLRETWTQHAWSCSKWSAVLAVCYDVVFIAVCWYDIRCFSSSLFCVFHGSTTPQREQWIIKYTSLWRWRASCQAKYKRNQIKSYAIHIHISSFHERGKIQSGYLPIIKTKTEKAPVLLPSPVQESAAGINGKRCLELSTH